MQETPETLMGITSDLLESLAPILQRNISTLQQDPNPFLQHRIQQEIEHHKGLLQQMEEVKERLQNYLNVPASDQDIVPEPDQDDIPEPDQDRSEPDLRQDEAMRRRSYPPGGPIGVTMFGTESGPEQIRLSLGAETFVEVIEKIGIERVKDLGIVCRRVPLIDTTNHQGISQRKSGRYFVVTSSSTPTKIKQLNTIADQLDEDLITDHL